MRKTILVGGMSCHSCKALIEDIAKDVTGITSVSVNVERGTAEVEYATPEALSKLKKEIETAAHYKIEIPE